jgi:drug/metabolite transporter (DMT)-like permease
MTPLLAALMEGRASGGLLVPLVGGVAGAALLSSQGLSFGLTQWAGAAAVLVAGLLIAASVVWVKRNWWLFRWSCWPQFSLRRRLRALGCGA